MVIIFRVDLSVLFNISTNHSKAIRICTSIGTRSHRSDGVSGETNPLCRTAGFDALFAITDVEVAQVRDIMEKMVAAPR